MLNCDKISLRNFPNLQELTYYFNQNTQKKGKKRNKKNNALARDVTVTLPDQLLFTDMHDIFVSLTFIYNFANATIDDLEILKYM